MRNHKSIKDNNRGFTLLEILLAMFIFTIVAMIITGALHSVISTQTATESRAKQLAELQIAFTLIARDFQQTINRPVTTPNGGVDAPFLGSPTEASFTHGGLSNPLGQRQRSTLQRTRYFLKDSELIRESWPQLDLTPQSTSQKRTLLKNVDSLQFQYLDLKGHFSTRWPSPSDQNKMVVLPRAVKILVTLRNLGKMNQLYIIPGEPLENPTQAK